MTSKIIRSDLPDLKALKCEDFYLKCCFLLQIAPLTIALFREICISIFQFRRIFAELHEAYKNPPLTILMLTLFRREFGLEGAVTDLEVFQAVAQVVLDAPEGGHIVLVDHQVCG